MQPPPPGRVDDDWATAGPDDARWASWGPCSSTRLPSSPAGCWNPGGHRGPQSGECSVDPACEQCPRTASPRRLSVHLVTSRGNNSQNCLSPRRE